MILNFHDIIRLHFDEADFSHVNGALSKRFGFLSFEPGTPAVADMQLSVMDPALASSMVSFRKTLEPFYIVVNKNIPYVCYYRRGKLSRVIEFGNVLNVRTVDTRLPSKYVIGTLVTGLHFAARRKGGVIANAEAVVKNDKCILVLGPSGSGKTAFLIGLIKAGWNFLGNDHILLHGGYAYSLDDYIVYGDSHTSLFPDLYGSLSISSKNHLLRILNKHVVTAYEKLIPFPLVREDILNRCYCPYLKALPSSLVTGCKKVNKARITQCIILRPVDDFRIAPCSKEQGMALFSHLLAGGSGGFYKSLSFISHHIQVCREMDTLNVPPLEAVLGDIDFYTLCTGTKLKFEERLRKFLKYVDEYL